jgi:hypothetical protein
MCWSAFAEIVTLMTTVVFLILIRPMGLRGPWQRWSNFTVYAFVICFPNIQALRFYKAEVLLWLSFVLPRTICVYIIAWRLRVFWDRGVDKRLLSCVGYHLF